MKKFLLLLIILNSLFAILHSQTPQAFKYQAIARDAQGNIIANQQIALKISIIQGSMDGQTVYAETHTVMTNEFGLINIDIGKGRTEIGEQEDLTGYRLPATGYLKDIDWSQGPYFLKIEIDPEGSNDYTEMGTSQLLSVPYALYAEESGNSGSRSGEWTNSSGEVFLDEGAFPGANVGIGTSAPGGKLHVQGEGFNSPVAPMLFVEHRVGFSSTFRRVVNNAGNALFLLQKSRGTYSSPSPVQTGDNIGQIRMEGYDGSNYAEAGYVRVLVDDAVATGSVPGAVVFATTPIGSFTSTERMRINSSGEVGIGTVNTQGSTLTVYDGGSTSTVRLLSGGIYGSQAKLLFGDGLSYISEDVDDDMYYYAANHVFNGWMGIGSTMPRARLEVAGGKIMNHTVHLNDTLPGIDSRNHSGASNQWIPSQGTWGMFSAAASDGSEFKVGLATNAYGSNGIKWGIWSNANGSGGPNYGIYSQAINGGINYGIYSLALGGTENWAGYFDGNTHVNGVLGVGTTNPSAETQVHIVTETNDNFGVLVEAGTPGSEVGLHTATSLYSSLVKNAYYSGGFWNRFNTGYGAFLQQVAPDGQVDFKVAPSGTNPFAFTNALSIKNDGNVGIGTLNPQQKLNVNGNGQFDLSGGSVSISTPLGFPGIIAYENTSGGHRRDIRFDSWGILLLTSSSSSAPSQDNGISLNENGEVGIYTANPTVKLDINSNSIRIRTSSTPTSGTGGWTGEIRWDASYIYICTSGDGPGGSADTWKKAALSAL